ncbi:hypothetical protein HK097_004134, partial [Rhizophlyctis rosea]
PPQSPHVSSKSPQFHRSIAGGDFSDAGSLADEKEFESFLEGGHQFGDPARELELASAALQAEQKASVVNTKARKERDERDEHALFRGVTAHLAHNSFDNTLLLALGKIPGFPDNTNEKMRRWPLPLPMMPRAIQYVDVPTDDDTDFGEEEESEDPIIKGRFNPLAPKNDGREQTDSTLMDLVKQLELVARKCRSDMPAAAAEPTSDEAPPPPVPKIPPRLLADEALLKLDEVLDQVADFHQTTLPYRSKKRSALDWDMLLNLGDMCDMPENVMVNTRKRLKRLHGDVPRRLIGLHGDDHAGDRNGQQVLEFVADGQGDDVEAPSQHVFRYSELSEDIREQAEALFAVSDSPGPEETLDPTSTVDAPTSPILDDASPSKQPTSPTLPNTPATPTKAPTSPTSQSETCERDPTTRNICTICRKVFSRPVGLKEHMVKHTGERSFRCGNEGCGRGFGTRSNLRRHERICAWAVEEVKRRDGREMELERRKGKRKGKRERDGEEEEEEGKEWRKRKGKGKVVDGEE